MITYKELMESTNINYTEINKYTEKFLKDIQKLMKMKKYKYKRSKSSANFEMVWSKGKDTYALDGWHGDGKYGNMMLIIELYEGFAHPVKGIFGFSNNKDSYLPGMPKESSEPDTLTKKEFKEYKENLKKAYTYLEKTAK